MPLSTSNFKRILRLPRLFFRRPTLEESVHGGPPLEFVRPIPEVPWRGITVVIVLVVMGATMAWELYCRSLGYGPGSCVYPVLAELASDENFHGTIICSIVPRLFIAPPGTPPMQNAEKAVRRCHTQTPAQRASQYLAMPLEEHVAFLKQEELNLEELLKRLPIPNRPYAQVPPRLPPYFGTLDRERRARMIEECARPGKLQSTIQQIWLPLFTPPPPPTYIPREGFVKKMGQAIEQRFHDVAAAVQKLRARGGKVVFVRFPHSGELKKLEDRETPRAGIWDRVIKDTGAPGIYYEDYPELSGFNCPEWSHLSAGDSVEFSKRLVPHLRKALQM